MAWYAVGCYYYAAGQHANARRYFGKATSLDDAFAPAWLAFGHAFSAQDESDQVWEELRFLPCRKTNPTASIPASLVEEMPNLTADCPALHHVLYLEISTMFPCHMKNHT